MRTKYFLLICLLGIRLIAEAQNPSLSVSLLFPNVAQISWPADSSEWRLTTTTNLTLPVTWDPVPDTPTLQDARFVVNYSIGSQPHWFRLQRPAGGCLFHATPPVIQVGGFSVLSWCATAGTSYQLLPTPGPVAGTNYVVSPASTTTYTLVASNASGVTTTFTTVTVVSSQPCDFANATSWDCTLSYSYELTPSSADYRFVIRHEGHLSIHLNPFVIAPPLLVEFNGDATGNVQLNDRMEDLGFSPPAVYTVIGSGAPAPGSSRLTLDIDCPNRTYTFSIAPAVQAVWTSPSASQSLVLGSYMNINHQSLPATFGELSGSAFVPVRGPLWVGEGNYYRCIDSLGDSMFATETVNDDTAGSATVTWSFTPRP